MNHREPRLAPPGAGLPLPELLIGRLLFALRRLRGTRDSFTNDFVAERRRVAQLVAGCDPALAGQRVLIPRPRGIEDSSRNWSMWMTLDHLRIVHLEFVRVISTLGRGGVPDGVASTAAVKPSPGVGDSIVVEYEQSCDTFLETVASVGDLRTRRRFAHPWFGPLDAAGWHALAGTHLRIHRAQIEAILRALPDTRSGPSTGRDVARQLQSSR